MSTHIVRDGNAFYEIDDDCMERKMEELLREHTIEKEPDEPVRKDGEQIP
ncbi:MAG: hypothetical protein LUI07_04910 [Lachnospiraceae bacterium]|nr:hypothetical protein [Lachnospiraceae bacterium]